MTVGECRWGRFRRAACSWRSECVTSAASPTGDRQLRPPRARAARSCAGKEKNKNRERKEASLWPKLVWHKLLDTSTLGDEQAPAGCYCCCCYVRLLRRLLLPAPPACPRPRGRGPGAASALCLFAAPGVACVGAVLRWASGLSDIHCGCWGTSGLTLAYGTAAATSCNSAWLCSPRAVLCLASTAS